MDTDTSRFREEITVRANDLTAAAERGDTLTFTALAQRAGSLEEAQALIRDRGIVRMVDRVRAATLPALKLEIGEGQETRDDQPVEEPTMFGHFAVFNTWAEIDSIFEGHFMERIAPGAFKKTFQEGRDKMRSLFQHGYDPQIGDKPLGPITELKEDGIGGYYEVSLLDAPYVRTDLLPGLQTGLYGASFRFKMMKEEFDDNAEPSNHNPRGLPERTLREVQVFEFGPVTFPAYEEATAAVRSQSEEQTADEPVALQARAEGTPHSNGGSRVKPLTHTYSLRREEEQSWRLP